MMAEPLPTAVASPFLSTVTTVGSVLCHMVPEAGFTSSLWESEYSCLVCPSTMRLRVTVWVVVKSGWSAIRVTATGTASSTLITHSCSSARWFVNAVMVARPLPTAVTLPDWSTVATSGLLLTKVMVVDFLGLPAMSLAVSWAVVPLVRCRLCWSRLT